MKKILHNGKVRTGRGSYEEAMLVDDGYIKAVGSNEKILSMDKDAELIDLGGRLALPGFNDSHMHFLNIGYFFSQIGLGETKSIEEAIDLIKSKTEDASFKDETSWIQCYGWNDDNWKEKRHINRYDLDKISMERPIVAVRVCFHVCAVNSKALELLGIDENSEQPSEGGFYVDENGIPTGVLYEMLPQVYEKIPKPTVEDIKNMILDASKAAAATGLTSVQTDDFRAVPGDNRDLIIRAYNELSEEGKTLIRVNEQCCIMYDNEFTSFENAGLKTGQGNQDFKLGPLKTFCDGSLGARTAWLCDDYSDAPGVTGVHMYEKEEELFSLVERAHKNGMPVAIHCIGDGAAEQAVSAIENAMKKYPETELRHGIVHAQVLNEDLLQRLAKNKIIAYMQPVFLEYDLHIAESRLGKARLEDSYNYRKMYDMGICIPFGTDSPVEPFAPMSNIYCAVNGKDFNGLPEDGWHTEKLLSLDESVECYTEASAYASGEENYKGKLQEGYLADIVVLEEDIFEIPPEKIKDVKVYMTMMGGKVTYRA